MDAISGRSLGQLDKGFLVERPGPMNSKAPSQCGARALGLADGQKGMVWGERGAGWQMGAHGMYGIWSMGTSTL